MKTYHLLLIPALVVVFPALGRAHAFVDHAEPKVGATVRASPTEVKVWFTQKLVAPFSNLQVFDGAGKEVDKCDKKVSPSDPALFIVSVPPLKPGKYKVVWRAASVDTHVTNGDFSFEVAP